MPVTALEPRPEKAHWPLLAAFLLASLTGACSDRSDASANAQAAGTGIPPLPAAESASRGTPGLAAALSISGSGAPQGDAYQSALGCAVALRVLAETIESMPALAGETEQAALRQAQTIYGRRAAAEARRQGVTEKETSSEMETLQQLAFDDPMPQVRRAAGCLRQLTAART